MPVKMAKIKKTKPDPYQGLSMGKHLTSHTLLVRIQDGMNILENNLTMFYKIKNAFFIWPSNSTF